MKMISVKSSNIQQIGWEERRVSLNQKPKAILRIAFNTGMVYDYHDVPKEVYESFLKAESIGKYFWANIKDKYNYERVK